MASTSLEVKLCETCQKLQLLSELNFYKLATRGELQMPDFKFTDSAPDFPKLKESVAQTGCGFCSFLITTLLSPEVGHDGDETERIRTSYRPPQDCPVVVTFHRAQFVLMRYNLDPRRFWLMFEIWISHRKALIPFDLHACPCPWLSRHHD